MVSRLAVGVAILGAWGAVQALGIVPALAIDPPADRLLTWRETAAIEHQDRMRRLERLARAQVGVTPTITESVIRAADLPAGIGVDLAVARLVFSEKVFFDTGSSELTPEGRRIVSVVAEALRREASDTAVFVAGHTDSRAGDGYNYDLSVRRADGVARALFAAGVAQARIWRVGFGEALPLKLNDTADHMATNRRVEFLFARKAEAASVWLARQPAELCGVRGADCARAIALLPRVTADPVTRATPSSAVARRRDQDRAVVRAPEAAVAVALPSIDVGGLAVLSRAGAQPVAAPDEARTEVVIKREDPVVLDLREERVFVGRPQR